MYGDLDLSETKSTTVVPNVSDLSSYGDPIHVTYIGTLYEPDRPVTAAAARFASHDSCPSGERERRVRESNVRRCDIISSMSTDVRRLWEDRTA